MKQIFKKTLCGLFATLLMCSFVPPALAANTTSGACGDDAAWSFENGVLTISGSGKMTSFTGWKPLRASITSIVVEEGITSICTYAFEGCSSAATVSLPSTLTSIGAAAFSNCQSLTEINIPEGVQTIGTNSFTRCTGLVSLTLPGTLTALADSAFGSCSSLSNVTLSEGIEVLSQSAFMNCGSLASITIPSTVTRIEPGIFFNCGKLMSVYFLGDAPEVAPASMQSTPGNNPSFADRVTLYYKVDTNGWTSPTWNGYKTALWNDSDSPFLDIAESDYYYDAALWALENGVTSGTKTESFPGAGDGLFSPDVVCTRGQVVTFLWRADGKPAASGTSTVAAGYADTEYYKAAVSWADTVGLLVNNSGFLAAEDCPRADIVTYLYLNAVGKTEKTDT